MEGATTDNSPYWSAKAAFLKRDIPVQALSTEMIGLGDFEYACALANASLATYAKLGGTPWLLRARPSTDHELVFGLGAHTHKEGRRDRGRGLWASRQCFPVKATTCLTRERRRFPLIDIPRNYGTHSSQQSNAYDKRRLGALGMRFAWYSMPSSNSGAKQQRR